MSGLKHVVDCLMLIYGTTQPEIRMAHPNCDVLCDIIPSGECT
jgi:hypothetical protein